MVLDIFVIALIALSMLLGYKKGLVNLAIKLMALFLSLLISVFLYNPIANFVINVTNIDETIENHIYDKVLSNMEEDKVNGEQKSYLGITVQQAKDGMMSEAARSLSINIVRLGVFIILLVGLRIGLNFVSALANLAVRMPMLRQFNQIGGAAYGLLRGLLVLLIALSILQIITETTPKNVVYEQVEKSYVTKFAYDNNIINKIFH